MSSELITDHAPNDSSLMRTESLISKPKFISINPNDISLKNEKGASLHKVSISSLPNNETCLTNNDVSLTESFNYVEGSL